MAHHGAKLQSYNNELVKCIDELSTRKDELKKEIQKDEEERMVIQNELRMCTDKLAAINEHLAKKLAAFEECSKIITEAEESYKKILENSQSLIQTIHKDSTKIDK